MKKTLQIFSFMLMLGVSFLFADKAYGAVEQTFDIITLPVTGQATAVGTPFQQFSFKNSGQLMSIMATVSSTYGTGTSTMKMYNSSGGFIANFIGNYPTTSLHPFFNLYTTSTVMVAKDANYYFVLDNYRYGQRGPSSTYTNTNHYDKGGRDVSIDLNYDFFLRFSIQESTSTFYIQSPTNGAHTFEYYEDVPVTVKCYSPDSYVAVYNDTNYLTAQDSDFKKCDAMGFWRGTVKAEEGYRQFIAMDKNWLTTPTDYYLTRSAYVGAILGTTNVYKFFVAFPDINSKSGQWNIYNTLSPKSNYKFMINYLVAGQMHDNFKNKTKIKVDMLDETNNFVVTSTPVNALIGSLAYNNQGRFLIELDASSTTTFKYYKLSLLDTSDQSVMTPLYLKVKGADTTLIAPNLVVDDNDVQAEVMRDHYADVIIPDEQCSSDGSMYGALYFVVCKMFIPEKADFQRFSDLKDKVATKPPFGYFAIYQDTMEGITTSTVSSTIGMTTSTGATFLSTLGKLKTIWIFEQVYNIIAWLLWLLFGFWIFHRFRHFSLHG